MPHDGLKFNLGPFRFETCSTLRSDPKETP
jgi:hypothetical protein